MHEVLAPHPPPSQAICSVVPFIIPQLLFMQETEESDQKMEQVRRQNQSHSIHSIYLGDFTPLPLRQQLPADFG